MLANQAIILAIAATGRKPDNDTDDFAAIKVGDSLFIEALPVGLCRLGRRADTQKN
jgi:hypothetical protein